MRLGILAGLLALLAVTASLPARALDIAAFYGVWEGQAISESAVSTAFQFTSRDIDVEVRPAGDGFTLTWQTVQRQKGNPDDPTAVLRKTVMTFTPVRPGVWQATPAADPVTSGQPQAWAAIEDNTLIVTVLQVTAKGGYELQGYRRTLSGTGMQLRYTRIVDGDLRRTAEGRLIKVAK